MPLPPGTKLGPYEVVGLLGAGGMGEVYRARDTRLGRDVAVKVLPRGMADDPERRQRFEAEARAAGALNHPNIVTLHDIGVADGVPYLVTEVLEGESLRAALQRGPIAPDRAIDIVTQVAAGLEAAHAKGIVHRDLKPENLFVLPDGRLKILDFGIAKLMRTEASPDATAETTPVFASLTATGTIMGTVSYMAPEQLRDRPVDQRADLFALGAILHELLSGCQPFVGETAADRVSAILTASPPPLPKELDEALPGIRPVLDRVLAKRPEQRFQSASDFVFALDLIRHYGVSSGASAAPVTESARSHDIAFRPLTFRDGSVEGARFSPDGQTVVYRAAWDGAPSDIYVARVESPEASALGLPNASLEAVSASAEIALRLRIRDVGGFLSLGTLARIPMIGGRPREVAESVYMADWSPDGKSLAAIRMVDGRLRLEAPLGRVVHTASGWISYPRWSPDGTTIAFGEHPTLGNNAGYVCTVRPGEPHRRISPMFEMVSRNAWRPDSQEVWIGGQMEDGASGIFGISLDGAVRQVYSAPGLPIVTDFSKDGDALVIMVKPRMRLEAGSRLGGPSSVRDLSWLDWSLLRDMNGEGSSILFDETGLGAGGVPGIYLRSMDGAPAIRLGDGVCSRLSQDGRWVLAGDHRTPSVMRMIPTGAGEPRTMDLGEFSIATADWIPGSDRLFVIGAEPGGSRRSWIYDPSSGERRAVGDDITVGSSAMTSPDGRHVIVRDSAQRLLALDLERGAARRLDAVDSDYRVAGWAADSKSILAFNGGGIPARVLRIDIESGDQAPWTEIQPMHRSGVHSINNIRFSADGEQYACSYVVVSSTLYLARGLV
jgi:serine/threonine protein kinase/Tol biopolymer transport system component